MLITVDISTLIVAFMMSLQTLLVVSVAYLVIVVSKLHTYVNQTWVEEHSVDDDDDVTSARSSARNDPSFTA